MNSKIRRLSLLAAFVAIGASALGITDDTQIKISRALNSPTLAVKYSGVHVALVELRMNGESFGTRTMDDVPVSGETTFTLDLLSLRDGENNLEIRLYDKAGHVVGTQKTVITTDSNVKSPVFLNSPKMGETVQGPVEISVGFGRDFKNVYVSFFIDNQFKSMMNFPPYNYTWDSSRETNGWHELEAWVVDDTSATFKTRKLRIFVNNPGGRTYRTNPAPAAPKPAAAPLTKAVTPAAKPVAPVAKPIVKPAAKKLPAPMPSKAIPVLPAAKPLELATSPNLVNAGTTGSPAAFKPMEPKTHSEAVITVSAPAAPAVTGFLTGNQVLPKLEGGAAGMKPAEIPASVANGLRLMTPTGKRAISPKAAPKVMAVTTPAKIEIKAPGPVKTQAVAPVPVKVEPAKVAAPAPKPAVVAAPAPAVVAAPAPTAVKPVSAPVIVPAKPVEEPPVSAVAPAVKVEAPVATVKPMRVAASGESVVVQMEPTPLQPHEPAVAPAPKPAAVPPAALAISLPSTEPIAKPAVVAKTAPAAKATRLLKVEFGTKLPIRSAYSIYFKGKALSFDVAPTIEQGVPVTPFRHLIEKAGGDVTWDAAEHEVQAETDGRSIWLKIGDKVAKINNLPITLELAPFLKQGRAIVPLSFIKSALNVDIDYDKATGHVLITPKS